MVKDVSLVILAAGSSSRFKKQVAKQWIRIEDDPLWLFVVKRFFSFYNFKECFIVASKDDISYMKNYVFDEKIKFIQGGTQRQYSLKNALKKIKSKYVLVSDSARACVNKDMIQAILNSKEEFDSLVPFVGASDTIYYNNKAIKRENIKSIQTPQLSLTKTLKNALKKADKLYTDESSLIADFGGIVKFVKGDKDAKKITFNNDTKELSCLNKASNNFFIGNGFDVHPFEDNKKMVLCGVEVTKEYGFKAHSDGDVAIHALIDAILGAMGAGDIGELFPDSDDKYKNIDSTKLLTTVVKKVFRYGYEIVNVDLSIIAQQPKLKEYKNKMRHSLAKLLQIEPVFVNIKATTTEKLGFIGRGEGVGVLANATLKYYDWTK
jgi:2-C-methyl-D-erythritol 4-phosphate cytidylyltransferase/2-C-methyl-D-erythritol 2,4-cyclodiphosphate synthase